jgi:uncharacterized repeat protein (TIGR03803 family)
MSTHYRSTLSELIHALILVLATSALAGTAITAQAQTYKDIYDATGGNLIQNPTGVIAQGRNGSLFGASETGGTFYGAIFTFTTAGKAKVINDIGYFPAGGLTLGSDGQFYGVDGDGGVTGNCGLAACGQVYKVTSAGKVTILHNFTGNGDGDSPQSSPIEASNGLFYGTTPSTNGNNSTIYSVSSKGVFTTLATFTGSQAGYVQAPLIQGSDGNFYGQTVTGGTSNDGFIFQATPAGAITILHNFTGAPDGVAGNYALLQASDGNFYGVTSGGGSFYGIVFKLTPAGKYTVLHTFNNGPNDGSNPNSSLIEASDGKLYGVTNSGGTTNAGTIFSITTGGAYSVLYNFSTATGENPSTPLRQDTTGKFYGGTFNGGAHNAGVLYSFDMGLPPFVSLTTTSGAELSKVGILGQGFSKTSIVEFGGVAATKITVSGTTFITASLPTGAQSGPVTVTTGSTTLTSQQSFAVLPAITSFTPTSGPVGTVVTITGTGLVQTNGVTFDGVAAAKFTVTSDTAVTADVPTGAKTGKIGITTKEGSAVSKASFKVK